MVDGERASRLIQLSMDILQYEVAELEAASGPEQDMSWWLKGQ